MPEKRRGKIIAVVGGIATGKSTLARLLAVRLKAHLFGEKIRGNPYLKEQYTKNSKIFENYIWFFNSELKVYNDALKLKQVGKTAVIDTSVTITPEIYRQLYFKGHDAKLLKDLIANTINHLPLPDITIFLTGSNEFILKRLQRRGRKVESNLSEELIKNLNALYSRAAKKYKGKILRVDIEAGDFNNERVLSEIAARLNR